MAILTGYTSYVTAFAGFAYATVHKAYSTVYLDILYACL